ncbi:UBXN10 [Branchiostoma lanceolatum]|uniref:UBXN10 protein n=1 Tax=Branchiostoma lanceolatum TaxID=7740 RepID=A0A8J9WGG9_BRALA|nr:UBXN10 [Branchiostoma lanceolatum]
MARPVSRHGGRKQYGRSPMAPTGSEAGGNFMFPDSPSPSYGGEFVPSPPPTERPSSRRRGRIHDNADPTASPTATPNNTPETGHVRKMRPRYRVLPSIGPRPGTASEDGAVDGIAQGMDHMTLANQSGHSTGEPRKRHRKRSTEEETYPQSSSSQRTNQSTEDLRRKNRHDDRLQEEPITRHRPHHRGEERMPDVDDRTFQDERQDKEPVQTPVRPVSATWLARIPVPREPGVNQDRLQLALKLPGGQRLQRHFHMSDTLGGILAFAQTQTDQKLGTCEIAVQGTPQRLFTSSDFKKTIAESEILDKTLLYIQADEEEEEDDEDGM